MFNEISENGGGVAAPAKAVKPPSRAQRIAAWREERETQYRKACDAQCVCTPTKAQLLLIQQWESPPID